MKEINIYSTMESWLEEKPDAVIKGNVYTKNQGVVEITDENGYTQLININKLFAIVY